MFRIILNNALGQSTDSVQGSAVRPQISALDHSCGPLPGPLRGRSWSGGPWFFRFEDVEATFEAPKKSKNSRISVIETKTGDHFTLDPAPELWYNIPAQVVGMRTIVKQTFKRPICCTDLNSSPNFLKVFIPFAIQTDDPLVVLSLESRTANSRPQSSATTANSGQGYFSVLPLQLGRNPNQSN